MKYLCGQVAGSESVAEIVGLQDGVHYNVAVATTDGAGNIGPLSNVACGTPAAASGGTGGGSSKSGGGCAMNGAPSSSPAWGFAAALFTVAAAGLRRRTARILRS